MHKINENQESLSPFHDEFEVNLLLLFHNFMVDSVREYHKFVGLELDDGKFVGFTGTVRGDFDHTPYQEHKCPKCGNDIVVELHKKAIIFPFSCENCKQKINYDDLNFKCNDLCPVCHPKKYSLTNAVKSCGNCQHFDPTGESETPFSDGKIPESLPDEPFKDDFECHGNLLDMQPCEYWKISVIKCGACGAEHIGLPDWCGVCGEKIAVEV